MVWGGFVLLAAFASASTVAPQEEGSSKADPAWVDAGLRAVPFDAKSVQASARVVVSPDLRDPFLVAKREEKKPALQMNPDLRDPFATQRAAKSEPATPADLRDPFEAKCVPKTADGVKIQRPKALRPAGCPAARVDRRTRIARR